MKNRCMVRRNFLAFFYIIIIITNLVYANNLANKPYNLIPISGADGFFEQITVDGQKAILSQLNNQGKYHPYIYFKVPSDCPQTGNSFYVEVTYKDIGIGPLQLQYNSTSENYRSARRVYGCWMTETNQYQNAGFILSKPNFRQAQNLKADLRIYNPGGLTPLHIVNAKLYTESTPRFEKNDTRPWLKPYTGPRNNDIDASSLHGKVICGYQGWFRAPGDPVQSGWIHWSRDRINILPETLSFEMWPDMTEYSKKYQAGKFKHTNGDPAFLFSSADAETIDLHFNWMQQYGIDGVFVNCFVNGIGDLGDAARTIGYARQAAARTGRVFALEFDMTGAPVDQALNNMRRFWEYLIDKTDIVDDPRYLRHQGKPVLAIYGFFTDRFSAEWAHRIIDTFKAPGKYQVTLVGGCQWWWRNSKDPEWAKAFRRFDAIKPWNVGNTLTKNGKVIANTRYWADDIAEAYKHNMLYLPVIYPGFSWDNLKKKPPGSTVIPRRAGDFFREQFVTAKKLGLDMAFVAMFDEVDEGTAIFKITNNPPVGAHFLTLKGKEPDFYLRLTGKGTKLLHRSLSGNKKKIKTY